MTDTHSKKERLRGTGFSMTMILDTNKSNFGSQECLWFSYLVPYGILLQDATSIIMECDSYFITKCDKSLLQNASGFLLQNKTFITKCAGTKVKDRKINH